MDKVLEGKIKEKKDVCGLQIREKLGLVNVPAISLACRKFQLHENGWSHYLEKQKGIIEDTEYWEGDFGDPIDAFRESYQQLYVDSDKNASFDINLIEIQVVLGSLTTSAGHNLLIFGSTLKGDKYCAVHSLAVRELFRGCGLASLLKLEELRMAQEKGSRFIHVWHAAENPDFTAAVAPSLANGFLFYHGPATDHEGYEEDGCIHLRKYMDNKKGYSKVTLKKGKNGVLILKSPDQNAAILEHLIAAKGKKHPGSLIKKISELKTV